MNTTDIAPRLRLRHGSWNALRSVIAGERGAAGLSAFHGQSRGQS